MIRMLALDLDGTLAIANHQVMPKTRTGLHELHEEGVEIVIATGRRYRTARFVIDNLGLEGFAVVNGGALVKDAEQKTLHSETFSVLPAIDIARDFGVPLFAQRDAHEIGGADVLIDSEIKWNLPMERYAADNRAWLETCDIAASDEHFLVAGAFGEEDLMTRFACELQSRCPDTYLTTVVRHLQTGYYFCEIAQRDIDKWYGLTKIQKHLGIDENHICAVGDDLNDLPMVTRAGHGVAMKNAHQELQDKAVFICGHNQEEGLVDVIDYIRRVNAGGA